MKVLHVNAGNLYGGVETILATLAREGHECPSMEQHFALCFEGRVSAELNQAGAPVHMLGAVRISRPWTIMRARRKLRTVLRRERFDLVICHLPWSFAVFGPTVRAEGQKLGFWAHGFHNGSGWLERLARAVKPDLVIANSEYTGTGLVNLFPGIPNGIVYPPVPLADVPHRAQWRSTLRSQENADDDTVVIVQVSRLESWKGHRLHLEALSLLRNTPGWTCWFVGGPQKAEEQRYLEQLQATALRFGIADRVRFLGQRSDVSKLLIAADIFCQPNQEPEPFGMVFIEALWAGLPVVATAMGGAMEIVDQSCGLLLQPGDPSVLAESLLRLIESPAWRRQLGSGGAIRAKQLSDPLTQMNKLRELSLQTLG